MNENLYYIMDTYGCYYGVNKNSKIMAISNKDYATKFTYEKANNVIRNMIKPEQRYRYILQPASEGGEMVSDLEDFDDGDYEETRFDSLDTDWYGCIEDMISFCSQLRQYQRNLNMMLSNVDKEICDIMHYVEFYNLDAAKGYKAYKMLKESRQYRRLIKDEREKVSAVIEALGDYELIENMKKCLKQFRGLENRRYEPRVLHELFESVS